jgi:murein DD-endopeptidase MepM/ murein hydrolase activator NlpD
MKYAPLAILTVLLGLLISGCGYYYTVEKGDTIYSISKRYDVDPDRLMKENDINDPRKLSVGKKLRIPRVEGNGPIRPREFDDTPIPRSTPDPRDNAVDRVRDKVTPPPPQKKPVLEMTWPAKGVVLRPFGKGADGRSTDGIEIGAPLGSNVVAAAEGEVILASDEYPAYGKLLVIKHKHELVTLYAHNRKLLVRKGDKVAKGQAIAEIGDTGRVSKPTLHFEVRLVSTPVDPMKYLPPQ